MVHVNIHVLPIYPYSCTVLREGRVTNEPITPPSCVCVFKAPRTYTPVLGALVSPPTRILEHRSLSSTPSHAPAPSALLYSVGCAALRLVPFSAPHPPTLGPKTPNLVLWLV